MRHYPWAVTLSASVLPWRVGSAVAVTLSAPRLSSREGSAVPRSEEPFRHHQGVLGQDELGSLHLLLDLLPVDDADDLRSPGRAALRRAPRERQRLEHGHAFLVPV